MFFCKTNMIYMIIAEGYFFKVNFKFVSKNTVVKVFA